MTVFAGRASGESRKKPERSSGDGLLRVDGREMYRIAAVDAMPPFLVSVVSDSDHWMYVSSRGGLTCGRVSEDGALFPYETDDKLHACGVHTGPYTLVRVKSEGGIQLWEPLRGEADERGRVTRNLYKTTVGNELRFEEINVELGLTFGYQWNNSEAFGFVRTAWLENTGDEAISVDVVDGLTNLMPANVELHVQKTYSCMVNAYTRCDVDAATKLATIALLAMIADQAKPVESLKATTVWSVGWERAKVLLTTDQLGDFRRGGTVRAEEQLKGRRAAYLVTGTLKLAPGEKREWLIVADVNRGHREAEALRAMLGSGGDLSKRVKKDVALGTANLVRNVASSDGLQHTGDTVGSAHHFANVLFNNMRGGMFADGYKLPAADYAAFIQARSGAAYGRHEKALAGMAGEVDYRDLVHAARASGDADYLRLTLEYLPLTFGRRHGDPSRPWNRFAIRVKDAHGARVLNYQGNWRDIFQNWEALGASFPGYIESMIAKFVNASTVDGFNPYRVTREGIEWETPAPDDPWAFIGYWGDHQIVYLMKLLELAEKYEPGTVAARLGAKDYAYAQVPYRIKEYAALVKNPRDTIEFDRRLDEKIAARVAKVGADGKLMPGKDGGVHHVTLAEKLLVPVLAKLSNLVPDGGIWMNTQRPEWNDANNALVGPGLSMVTLCYLRRHLKLLARLFADGTRSVNVGTEVKAWMDGVIGVLTANAAVLDEAKVSPRHARRVMDALGETFGVYRKQVYAEGYAGGQDARVTFGEVAGLIEAALPYLEHAIGANRRDDGLFHAYNLLDVSVAGEARVGHLYPMLEGQVAVLSSGVLGDGECIELIETLFKSTLYRADQKSFMLYPERTLPGFLEKNRIAAEDVLGSQFLKALVDAGDVSVVAMDAFGTYRFCSDFRTTDDLHAALDRLGASARWERLVKEGRTGVAAVFAKVFNFGQFTGRSGDDVWIRRPGVHLLAYGRETAAGRAGVCPGGA